jgi:hypothetical protein
MSNDMTAKEYQDRLFYTLVYGGFTRRSDGSILPPIFGLLNQPKETAVPSFVDYETVMKEARQRIAEECGIPQTLLWRMW